MAGRGAITGADRQPGAVFRARWRAAWRLAVLLAVLLWPHLALAGDHEGLRHITLQLPWSHQFQFAGYYAALDQGYYRDAGFEVVIKEGTPQRMAVEEVVHRRAQYGVARSEVLLHYLKGEQVVALAAIFQRSGVIFLARRDSGIATPQDMVGRRVMLLSATDSAEYIATLRNEGISLAQLEVVPSSYDVNDLINGNTDVFNGYLSNEPFYLQERGIAASIIMPRTYGIDFYGDTLFTSQLELQKHPAHVKAFREATLKGWDYALGHPEEMISLLRQHYGVKKSLPHLRFEADAIAELVNADLVEVGHMNRGRWQHMADTYVSLGMAEAGYSLDDFLYQPEPLVDYGPVRRLFYLFLVLFVVGGIILLLLFNRRLNRVVKARTESLQATEVALLKKEKLYRFLFDNAPVGIALVREDGMVREFNRQALEITGYSVEEARNTDVTSIYRDPAERQKLIEAVRSHGIARDIELGLTRRDGTLLDVRATSVGIMVEERPHMLTLFEDVSRVKEVERERERIELSRQRMQKMEAIGLMAGGVAHDLNNILSGIVSYPELILMQLPEDSPLRKSVTEIHKSGQRAAAVVADLLTVARGVASAKEVHNLNTLIMEYLDSPEHRQLQELYEKVVFSSRLDPELANVACSAVHVKKSLMNLVTNGAEAITGTGSIDISTRNEVIEIGGANSPGLAPGPYAVLSISDTGPGISEQDKEHIFEPFYTKKIMGRSGTGLGLTVVWNTMQDHHGGIVLQSSDRGTVCELYFPACQGEIVHSAARISDEGLAGSGESVLVIDDESQQRDIASLMLESMGYRTHAVSCGEEAIAYLQQHQVDLLLLDMVMVPGINGRQTYEEILKLHPGQRAVICSGFSQNDEVRRTHELGAGGFLKKPYTREQLGRAVKQELQR